LTNTLAADGTLIESCTVPAGKFGADSMLTVRINGTNEMPLVVC